MSVLWPRRAKNRARQVKERTSFQMPAIPWRRLAPPLLTLFVIAGLVGGITFALDRPVRHIEVVGPFQRVSAFEVEQVVRANLKGGFVTADLRALQQSIEVLAWVDHARVQRHWPDAIAVQIAEQSAAARWGTSGLVNSRGDLFIKDARHVPPELPQLEGPDGSEHQVAELFMVLQPRLVDIGLSISGLRLDPRGSWELALSNGVMIRFGRRQLQERLERFIKAGAPMVAGRANDIAFLDMRYSNGFAVGWRTSGPASARSAASEDAPVTRKRDQDV
jgi:cell division protein FtsQ